MIVVALQSDRPPLRRVKATVAAPEDYRAPRHTHTVVVLVSSVNKGVLNAIAYARSLAPDRLLAVSVVGDPAEQEELAQGLGPTTTSRSSCTPSTRRTGSSPGPSSTTSTSSTPRRPTTIITVVIPEFVTSWKTQFLHNQSALALKARLLYRPDTVVTSIPVLVD